MITTLFNRTIAITILTFATHFAFAQEETTLQSQVENIVKSKQATVGVSVLNEGGKEIVSVNGNGRFPMQSTYKFHLALAILHLVDKGTLSLEQKIHVTKKDLLPNTHSPLRDKFPDGSIDISLKEIIEYTVSQSDNNGCDILFRLSGGPEKVNQYIRSLGIENINIAATEEKMHKDWDVQYTNWSTPLASARLLELFYQKKILSQKTHDFLWETMKNTTVGPNKIKGLLPKDTIVAHKTGSGGVTEDGVISASNDIGIVMLPNGKHFIIVTFVRDSKESSPDTDRIIAEISKATWDYFTTEKNK